MATADPTLPHNRTNIRDWFTSHPGHHQPVQVANAMNIPPGRERVRLYNELANLAREGVLTKTTAPPKPGNVRPIPLYSLPVPPTPRRKP